MNIKTAKRNRGSRKNKVGSRRSMRSMRSMRSKKGGSRAGSKGSRKGTRRNRMRGGNCGCNTSIFPLKGGFANVDQSIANLGSNNISALPIHHYYKQNDFQNDPNNMQIASRLNGGKKQKGGSLNATNIMNQLGDSTGTLYSIGTLTGSPYINSSITNQPIGDKYGASNLYLV